MNRTHYEKEQLLKVFEEIGEKVATPIIAYLFGGGTMVFRNQKPATKDLDLAFLCQADYTEFTKALKKSGFHKGKNIETPYVEMEAASIWQREDGFRLDLFVKVICKKLEVSEAMLERSEKFREFGNLAVVLLSNEDLVLLKGITERDRDEDDVANIVRSTAINWNIVLEECVSQSKAYPWYASLFNKFVKIKAKYGIDAPILDHLEELADHAILVQFYKDKLEEGKTREEIIKRLKHEGATEKEIEQVEKGL